MNKRGFWDIVVFLVLAFLIVVLAFLIALAIRATSFIDERPKIEKFCHSMGLTHEYLGEPNRGFFCVNYSIKPTIYYRVIRGPNGFGLEGKIR